MAFWREVIFLALGFSVTILFKNLFLLLGDLWFHVGGLIPSVVPAQMIIEYDLFRIVGNVLFYFHY